MQAAAHVERDGGVGRSILHVHGMYLRGRIEARRDHAVFGNRATPQQLFAPLVVDADHALGRIIFREQARLRLEVGLERVMVVQVILRQVGERRNGECGVPRAIEVERMRAHLHGHDVAARIAHAGEQLLQIGRFRRGMSRFLGLVADADAHGSDDARALPRYPRDVLYQVGRGGLAVGAGDAHQRNVLGRMVVEVRRRGRHGLARILHHDLRDVRSVGQVHLALDHEHFRAPIDGVLGERVPIRRHAYHAEERVAGLHPVAAVGDTVHLVVGVAEDGAVDTCEQFGTGLAHGFLTPDKC